MSEGAWKAFAVPSAVWVLSQPVDRYAGGVWIECLAAGACLAVSLRVLARPLMQYTEHVLAGSLVGFLVLGQAAAATTWGYSWAAFYAWLLNSALCFWFLVSNETGWEDWTRTHLARTWTGRGQDTPSRDTGQDTDRTEADSVPDVRTVSGTRRDTGGTAVRTRSEARTRPDTLSRFQAPTVRTSRMAQAGPYPADEEPVSDEWWVAIP
jgi:hypothetical protein